MFSWKLISIKFQYQKESDNKSCTKLSPTKGRNMDYFIDLHQCGQMYFSNNANRTVILAACACDANSVWLLSVTAQCDCSVLLLVLAMQTSKPAV